MEKAKRIIENWDAIEDIEKQIKEKTGDPKAGFNASSFFISGERALMLRAMYRKPKKEGFTKTYFDIHVLAKFCPFTGKPLYEDSET